MARELYIGVMSGTSLDGVDTALVAFETGPEAGDEPQAEQSSRPELLATDAFPMPDSLKSALLDVCMGQETNLKQIGQLDHQLGHLFADAVNQLLDKAGIEPSEVTAVGNHGQTVFHQPDGDYPFTMQLGDANIVAAKTGITTVADFRRKDMALGGQGAPLVPAFHKGLFSQQDSTTVVLNIGGIANISVLQPGQPVIGYDTGPGNMLMDAWVYLHHGQKYDKDGAFAASGTVNPALLAELMADPYLSRPYPKSTGREHYNLPWLEGQLNDLDEDVLEPDVQATLLQFTAQTIAEQVARFAKGHQPQLLVCGGGGNNPQLMQRLAELLPDWSVGNTRDAGIDPDYMEAMAFAWLARQRIHGLPSNVPEVTGASALASLGVVYPV
ncbi:anhydro-N-acetylmuramic acid kinase [Photobacterium rosenbergii]|uniref:anhydro-N-acetylmuramic acid kinase n=1 Tax=Photobacterium rosenbergii TaxID=294936 RepID=UPI001C9915DD|nr:anhydro-N-acetylmuramic acid kinase [Photobacterium rosenbergii]MBY5945266.1 anhydro-N-acetylmuramic acid kinase [Photobacterium rosenbergii]